MSDDRSCLTDAKGAALILFYERCVFAGVFMDHTLFPLFKT